MGLWEDNELIRKIASRAEMSYAWRGNYQIEAAYISSEVKIVHEFICKLRLRELLDADENDFLHDVCGIHDNLDILDGGFRNGFRPRFAE